ncbi:hypothetical protein J3E68DRAFT_425385 [Trichoderma sp. SZMC 28012]
MGSCFSMPNRHEQQKATISQTTPLLHDWDSFVKVPPNQLDAKLKEMIYRLLNQLDSGSWRPAVNNPEQSHLPRDAAVRAYESQLRSGLSAILGYGPISRKQSWSDALEFARAVIKEPQDTVERSKAIWTRSCSVVYRELMTRFGQEVRSMAEQGCTQLVNDHYLGERLSVPHVDKRASFQQNLLKSKPGLGYHPPDSFLAIAAYQCGILPCSLVASAWLSPEEALKYAALCHLSVCDDYSRFTGTETEVRVRLVAQAIGAIFDFGDLAVSTLLDSTAMQGAGSSNDVSIQSAMAWRSVSGAATPYNCHTLANSTLEEGLVGPQVIMAIHDLFDWRGDLAAGNLENGVSVAYGLGVADPFHAYLEAALLLATSHARSGVYAIATLIMNFTGSRYAAYKYLEVDVELPGPCPRCIELLRALTEEARFDWAPRPPPKSFEEGEQVRQWCQLWVDRYEHGNDLIQEGLSWFQSLVATGKIRIFDALVKIPEIDKAAGFV